MKLTKEQLETIIKEEIESVFNEKQAQGASSKDVVVHFDHAQEVLHKLDMLIDNEELRQKYMAIRNAMLDWRQAWSESTP